MSTAGRGGEAIAEFLTLVWVVLAGVAVGVAFDFYRTLRQWWGLGPYATFFADILFSLAALGIVIVFFHRANALAFRFYIIWGSLLGLLLYLRLASRWVVRLFFSLYRAISLLLYLIYRGIRLPLYGLGLLMRPPFALLRWCSLLLFRAGEATVVWPARQKLVQVRKWWEGRFPPGPDG